MREGKILDPEKLFFDEQGCADLRVDCNNNIIAPGFIDVQINGKSLIRLNSEFLLFPLEN